MTDVLTAIEKVLAWDLLQEIMVTGTDDQELDEAFLSVMAMALESARRAIKKDNLLHVQEPDRGDNDDR